MVLSIFIIGCNSSSENAKIKRRLKRRPNQKSFAKTLDMYPIKNLEDLYDKEGYRDGEFEKGDKGRGRYIQILPKVIKRVNWIVKVWYYI